MSYHLEESSYKYLDAFQTINPTNLGHNRHIERRRMASLEKIAKFVAVLITCFFVLAENKPNIKVLKESCLEKTVDEAGDAERTINDVLDQLLDKTANNRYSYEWDEPVGDDHSWGSAACNGVISNHDCVECLRVAKDFLIQSCPFRVGAHIKLTDCRLRYEPYEFHGVW